MTDNQRIQKAYAQVQLKYPGITDRAELDRLAIAQEKKNLRLRALLWFGGAVISAILYIVILMFASDVIKSANYILLCTAISGIVEAVINLRKVRKVQQQFQPVLEIQHNGTLTLERINRDGGRKLQKANGQYRLEICTLLDKEDDQDSTFDNLTLHTYYLHFPNPNSNIARTFKVHGREYSRAVVGSEYYLLYVTAPVNEIVAIYSAASWKLSPELHPVQVGSSANVQTIPEFSQPAAVQQPEAQQQAIPRPIEPNPVKAVVTQPEKTKCLLPILSMVCAVAGLFMPVIFALPVSAGGIVMSAIAKKQQNSALAKVSFVISIVLSALVALITAIALFADI